ncbi:hypothetical protein [Pectobacterium versatile]|uniref:hypothetical protein n=1 Tax=Pectobacterium versatile TaxID=2488639 RepID=UPI002B24074D|nr:hypothetical protein [Pectobacterium versatile]
MPDLYYIPGFEPDDIQDMAESVIRQVRENRSISCSDFTDSEQHHDLVRFDNELLATGYELDSNNYVVSDYMNIDIAVQNNHDIELLESYSRSLDSARLNSNEHLIDLGIDKVK